MHSCQLDSTTKSGIMKKNFLFAIMAGGLFILCDYLMLSFLPPFMVSRGYSEFMGGLQSTLFSAFCIVFRFFLAPLADTQGRKRLMLCGSGIFLAGCLLLLVPNARWGIIIASRVFCGAGKAAYLSTASCYISDIIPPDRRGLGIGIQRSMYSIALMTGPVGALKIIRSPLGYNGLFCMLALTAFCVIVLIALLRETVGKAEQKGNQIREYALLIRQKDVSSVYLLMVAVCLSLGSCLSFITIYTESLGLEQKTGLFFFWFAMAGLLGNLLGGHLSDRYAPKKLAFLLAFLSAMGTLLLVFLPWEPVAILVISAVLGGVGNASTASVNWLFGLVSARSKGAALGMLENFIDIGIALGALIFGSLALYLDYGMVYLVMGLIAFGIILGSGCLARSIEGDVDTSIAI